ncbi:hypothetical protein PCE1_004046 [Barthelona sp. PCE]
MNCLSLVKSDLCEPDVFEFTQLIRRSVESDGNCLFTALSYLISGEENPLAMRNHITSAFLDDIDRFKPFLQDADPLDYATSILGVKELAWGGEIELIIASRIFKIKIVVFDIARSVILEFNDSDVSNGFILLAYNGIHYDPVVFTPSEAFTTQFTVKDDEIFGIRHQTAEFDFRRFIYSESAVEAAKVHLKIVGEALHVSKQYVDEEKMSLICDDCQMKFSDTKAAQKHGETTGHQNFRQL